ncbi:hypothetical protein ACFQ9X_06810 [Catenulispora yoronensis]
MSRGTDEIFNEQQYLNLLYDRLDTLRARAAGQLAGVLSSDRGGTQQARTERDNLATAGAAGSRSWTPPRRASASAAWT